MRHPHLGILAAGLAALCIGLLAVVCSRPTWADAGTHSRLAQTVTPTPLSGRWGGTTERGNPVSFDVSPDSTQWSGFVLTTYFTATQCGVFNRQQNIPSLGPGIIASGQFSATGDFSFSGWFTASALATGTYALDNYHIFVGMDEPPFGCDYYLTETGAWSAGALLGTPTSTPTPTRTPSNTRTQTRTPTATRTPTHTFTPSATPTITRTPTQTRTPSLTRTITNTRTQTATPASSATITPTRTQTSDATPTVTRTRTITRTRTPTWTGTPSGFSIYLPVINRYLSSP